VLCRHGTLYIAGMDRDEPYLLLIDEGAGFGVPRFDLERSELLRGDGPACRSSKSLARETLAEEAQFSGNVRTVDVQMTRLRRKVETDPKFPRYIQTVRGTGYVFKPD
jgi:two-component system phosphate regulon response regulator OmpR